MTVNLQSNSVLEAATKGARDGTKKYAKMKPKEVTFSACYSQCSKTSPLNVE